MDIESKAINTYLKNLEFFETNFIKIYEKIKLFEESIEQGFYKEQWSLEYKDNKYFDIQMKDNIYLYDHDSNEYSDLQTKTIKFDMNNMFNTLNKINHMPNIKLEEEITISGNTYYIPLQNYTYKHRNKEKDFNLRKIDKFIFVGTGLGLHIPKIANKIKSKAYLIIEPNIEIFRLSLFVTDYTQIHEKPENLVFSISETQDEFTDTFNTFYQLFVHLNHIIKFDIFLESYDYYFNYISAAIYRHSPFSFPYSTKLASFERNINYFKNGYKFVNFNNPILENKIVCIAAAGPSLDSTISWIKENKEKIIVVAIGATLKKFEQHDIIPDIITSVDPYPEVLSQLDVDEKYYRDSILLCSLNTLPSVVEKFKKENVFLYPAISFIGLENIPSLSGSTVSEVTYALCLYMKAKEIYLFGTNAAFDYETGSSHMKGHEFEVERKEFKKANLSEDKVISGNDIIEVEGNLREKVYANRLFSNIIYNFNSFTKHLKKDTNVYNTADGAKFEDIEPKKIDDIILDENYILVDKNKTILDIKNELLENTITELSEKAKEDLDNDLSVLKTILKKIRKYKKLSFKDYNSMQYDRIGLIIDITEEYKNLKSVVLMYTYESYFLASNRIIYEYFEPSEKIRKNKKHANAMNTLWLFPVEKITLKAIDVIKKAQVK